MNEVQVEINRLVEGLKKKQVQDGSWRFCFEGPPMTDAYMIILLRSLKIEDEKFIQKLVRRLESLQSENGTWKIYHDEKEGNLSATVEAYFALLYSGYKDKKDIHMQKARRFIKKHGGLDKVNSLTKTMLAVTGQYPWDKYFSVPVEMMLLPQSFPINFFDFAGFARVHIAPVLVLADQALVLKTKDTPNISELLYMRDVQGEWRTQEERSLLSCITDSIKSLVGLPNELHRLALEEAKNFMLKRIEPDGTLYSYFGATFYMIFALLSLGYSKDDPIMQDAITGVKALVCKTNDHIHIQNSTSTIWDTALISHALLASGVDPSSSTIQKSAHYLLKKQQYRYADWVIRNQEALPGGWGFSDINTLNPDVDDTTAALRAISPVFRLKPEYRESWYRGVDWVLSMQNNDGGWPAFEKNTDKEILKLVPMVGPNEASIDPSTADLTGRTMEFLGKDARLSMDHPKIKKAVEWLLDHQKNNGSWYGRWGISYIYGTWAAITGMRAVGISGDHSSIQNGIEWLEEIQNEDGGWGESCRSDVQKRYVELGASTPSQTAWALDALISVYDHPTSEINQGIECLIKKLNDKGWTYSYPTGGGLPGSFYIYYHSYNYIWPLLTLSHYKRKYQGEISLS